MADFFTATRWQTKMIFLGIDGGATHTRAVLVSKTGVILGYGISGPSNYDNVGVEIAKANIRQAVQQAWSETDLKPSKADAAYLGMAGVVSESDRATIRQIVVELKLVKENKIAVDHDIRVALAGGLAGVEGIVLIVGTGSSCYGRRHDGRHHRTGWGYLLDDLGSGYYLGLQAMIAAVRAADGRGAPTGLSLLIQQALGYEHIDEIMRLLYHERMSVTQIAALAPFVLSAAGGGDAVALNIVEHGADELALMVHAVAQQLDFLTGPFPLIIAGGVANASTFYKQKIETTILRRVPMCSLKQPELPPVLGAALLAIESAGVPISPELLESLKARALP
jgi:N-acetylglucosamine kinase-like BadF-type ATPase